MAATAVFTLLLSACGKTELIVLLPGEDGKVGEISVEKNGETVVLDQALQTAEVTGFGNVSSSRITEEEVGQTFAAALAARPKKPTSFVLYFHEGTTKLASGSQAMLENLFDEVDERQWPEVQVTGHTDRVGKVPDNDQLALERAHAVREWLIGQGLSETLISAVGRGERELLISTEDEVREPRNRRVEIIVR